MPRVRDLKVQLPSFAPGKAQTLEKLGRRDFEGNTFLTSRINSNIVRKVGGVVGMALNSVLFVHEHPEAFVNLHIWGWKDIWTC